MYAQRTDLLRTPRAYPLIVARDKREGVARPDACGVVLDRIHPPAAASPRLVPDYGRTLTGMGSALLPAVGLPFSGTVSPLTSARLVGWSAHSFLLRPSGRTVTVWWRARGSSGSAWSALFQRVASTIRHERPRFAFEKRTRRKGRGRRFASWGRPQVQLLTSKHPP
jgi:hypothetical protein